ncbi:MAG: SGNH/GDSL hydrolase family protein [Victivallales bacterium]
MMSSNFVDYHDFLPVSTSRKRENIEWSQFYAFNARDLISPRVLLIGDSICCGYKDLVWEKLGDKVNTTFWCTSRCVTDPAYLRELDYVMDYTPYSLILFNNGLHSLVTPCWEWEDACGKTLAFIRSKQPGIPVSLVLSTPLKDPVKTDKVQMLNRIMLQLAEKQKLPTVDLFASMNMLDREIFWCDVYHFNRKAKEMQAEILVAHILECLKGVAASEKLHQPETETGPDGSLMIH